MPHPDRGDDARPDTGRAATPAFIDMPDRNRRVGPPPCNWRAINLDHDYCDKPSRFERFGAMLLCEEHARKVAENIGWESISTATKRAQSAVQWEIEQLRRENRRLQSRLHAPAKAPVKRKRPENGTIYYLRSGAHFKIGWTSDLEKRMKGYPPDFTLLATHPGTQAEERAIHRRYSHLLAYGREWFLLAAEVQDHIARIIAEHGNPPAVDFTAKRAKRIVGPRLDNYVGGDPKGKPARRTVRG